MKLAFVMFVFEVALLLGGSVYGVACGSRGRPSASEPNDGAETSWCFRLLGERDDVPEAGLLCFEAEATCKSLRRDVLKWGGFRGVTHVGACSE